MSNQSKLVEDNIRCNIIQQMKFKLTVKQVQTFPVAKEKETREREKKRHLTKVICSTKSNASQRTRFLFRSLFFFAILYFAWLRLLLLLKLKEEEPEEQNCEFISLCLWPFVSNASLSIFVRAFLLCVFFPLAVRYSFFSHSTDSLVVGLRLRFDRIFYHIFIQVWSFSIVLLNWITAFQINLVNRFSVLTQKKCLEYERPYNKLKSSIHHWTKHTHTLLVFEELRRNKNSNESSDLNLNAFWLDLRLKSFLCLGVNRSDKQKIYLNSHDDIVLTEYSLVFLVWNPYYGFISLE